VEPDPNDRPPISKATASWREHGPPADLTGHVAERPNALQNVGAALLTLPRVETIREDIELLIERNRDADRLANVWWAVDAALRDNSVGPPMPPVDEWRATSGEEWMSARGPQFRAYYRLHFASVLDDLARTVTRAAGFDEGSDEQSAIRCFVEAWAERRYPENGTGSDSQNEFLVRFDVEYRIRRIGFMQKRIDELLRFDHDAWARLLEFGMSAQTRANLSDWQADVTRVLHGLKASLDDTLGQLRAAGRNLGCATRRTRCCRSSGPSA
jgi:hypothetical protein